MSASTTNSDWPGIDEAPSRFGGMPCLEGYRIPLFQVVAHLTEGESLADLCRDFSLDPERVETALRSLAMFLQTPGCLGAAERALHEQIAQLQEDLEAARQQSGDLAKGITEAIGMAWATRPSFLDPSRPGVSICPDNQEIIARCAEIAAALKRLWAALPREDAARILGHDSRPL